MKKTQIVGMLAGCLVAVTAFSLAAFNFDTEKTGYVDLRVLFDGYEKTKVYDTQITEVANQKQAERDGLVEYIRRMKDEMVVLAEGGDEALKKQAEIDQKIKDLQAFDERTREELRVMRDEKVKEIFDDLNTAVEAFGKKKAYTYIFSDRALVYKDSKLDVTQELLKNINDDYKKK